MDQAKRNVDAAHAAIGAAIKVGGPTMQIGDLVSGMLASAAAVSNGAHTALRSLANDATAISVMVALVQMVGARRAHEIVDMVAKAGAGADFS